MEEKKGIKINFMGVISVLTFVVMGVGSTFAYFTASGAGELESMNVSSVKIVMNLGIEPLYTGMAMLPTNDQDIDKAFKNKCIDSYGSGACLAYTITLENLGYEQEGVATFRAESDSITNLKYMILDNDNDYAVLKGATPAMNATDDEHLSGIPVKLKSDNDKKTLTIVIWLSNLDKPQDEEQGASFIGQISFESTGGAKITGTMNENLILKAYK